MSQTNPPPPEGQDRSPETPAAQTPQPEASSPAPSAEKPIRKITRPAPPTGPRVVARYGLMRGIGEFRHNLTPPPSPGTKLVVRTERGVELATVVAPIQNPPEPESEPESESKPHSQCAHDCHCIRHDTLKTFLKDSGKEYPYRRGGRMLRPATRQDLIDFRHLNKSAQEAGRCARTAIKEMDLPMRLVTTEHLLGGERIVFYFTAEGRVDFRDLVRKLASQFHTRIEMRQVGSRDEARLVGDYERCGQPCCCRTYLKLLKPVSMRMAKVQKATLDPSKISGRCGRLMCCLRYEDQTYKDLKKTLPRKATFVRTATCIGKVIDTQILTQLVRLAVPNQNALVVVPVDEILERDVNPDDADQLKALADARAAARAEAARVQDYSSPMPVGPIPSEDAPR